jgi:patatin-related protein
MRDKELRLALVCYGGISLAVYMHGVTKELWHLARASRAEHDREAPSTGVIAAYRALLSEIATTTNTRLRVFADIIAGASAGGINGVFLARAIVSGESLEPLTELWLTRADVEVLLDPDARPLSRLTKFWAVPLAWTASRVKKGTIEATVERSARPEIRAKLSQFVRARWFEPPFGGHVFGGLLLDALDAMAAGGSGPALVPPGHPVDLMVTVTDYAGHMEPMRLNSPAVVNETEHRLIFSFRHNVRGAAELDDPVGLVFAARATASFPGAFPPFTARELDATLAARQRAWPEREAFLARQLPRQHAAGEAADTILIDGSVLANAPFRPAIAALRQRPARREVDRRFVYIDPKPGKRSVSLTRQKGEGEGEERLPGFFATMLRAMSDIPREQPIRDNVETIEGISTRIRRMQHILNAMQGEVEERIEAAFGRTFFLDRPTPARLAAWRATAQKRAEQDAGYSYVAYGHLKLSAIVEDLARLLPAIIGDTGADPAVVRQRLWSVIRARGIDRIGEKRGSSAAVVDFFRQHDVGYRIRRLRQLARKLDVVAGSSEEADTPALEAMRTAIFSALGPYLERDSSDFYRPLAGEADIATLLDRVAAHRDLITLDAATDAALAEGFAALPKAPRRAILYAYLGFPFYDTATLPLLQGEGQDEFDPVKIDRISPDDATILSAGQEVLKGTQFNSFGAFFSRAFRENDYLWGRLHAAERLFDITLSAMPAGTELAPERRAALLNAAFRAILEEEAPRLAHVADLISDLRARTAATPR